MDLSDEEDESPPRQINAYILWQLRASEDNKAPPLPWPFKKNCFYGTFALNTFFHLLVQNKTVCGLDHFQFYCAAAGLNRAATVFGRNIPSGREELLERRIRFQLSTPHIRRLEFRISFPDREKNARKTFSQFLRVYQKILCEDYCTFDTNSGTPQPIKLFPRVGIVFHFLKSRQETPDACFARRIGPCRHTATFMNGTSANELGITYMGMVERGVGREACPEWIERLRESGMHGGFIRQTDSDGGLLKELDALIAEL